MTRIADRGQSSGMPSRRCSRAAPRGHDVRSRASRRGPRSIRPARRPSVDSRVVDVCRCPGRSTCGGSASASSNSGHGCRRSRPASSSSRACSCAMSDSDEVAIGRSGRASSSAFAWSSSPPPLVGGPHVAPRVARRADHHVGRLDAPSRVKVVLAGLACGLLDDGDVVDREGGLAVPGVQRPRPRRAGGRRARSPTARAYSSKASRRLDTALAACAPVSAARYASARMPARSKWTDAWIVGALGISVPNSPARACSRRSSPAGMVPYRASRRS